EFTRRYRDLVLSSVGRPYEELLRELGVEDPDEFIDAEHEAWRPAHQVLASAQALLEALRARGLKTGVVANSWPEPGRVLRRDAERFGFGALLDVQVWSEEVGMRKPEPAIFLHAASELGVDPSAVLFVADRLDTD